MAKSKPKPMNPFAGRWRIVSMSAWVESFIDEEVIPANPPQSCCPGNMLMGEMASLVFPIHDLRGRNGHRLIAKFLNF